MCCMATRNGLEPSTSSVTGWRANRLHHRAKYGGNNRARTCDLLLVRQMLSQLSYAPKLASPSRFAPQRRGLLYTLTATLSSTIFVFFFDFLRSRAEPYSLPKNTVFRNYFFSFFRSLPIASGVNRYFSSQNWHSTGKSVPSSIISFSSFSPRLISAASTRSREQ